jgi:hypothetical protein
MSHSNAIQNNTQHLVLFCWVSFSIAMLNIIMPNVIMLMLSVVVPSWNVKTNSKTIYDPYLQSLIIS